MVLLRTYMIPSDSTRISKHKKSRPSADICQDLAIYGHFRYAHRSQYCINPNVITSNPTTYLIQCNDSLDFAHPRVQNRILLKMRQNTFSRL